MIKVILFGENQSMKKLFVLITILIILANNFNAKDFSLLEHFDGEYYAYTKQDHDGAKNLGFCYMTNEMVENKIGESMVFKNLEIGAAIDELNAKVVKTERVLDATIIYCYTDKIDDNVDLFDTKVNLQIAQYEDRTIIGWPLILGSY